MAHDVFISHAHRDKRIADAICQKLESAQVRCWIAERDISPGEDWTEATRNAIGSSRLVVLVLSENANAAPHIEREIAHAFYTGRKIVPLRLTNTLPRRDFLFYLGNVRSLDAFGLPAEQQLEALTASVNGLVSSRTVTREAIPHHGAKETAATLNFSDSWIGAFRASHYQTLEILKRVVIAASIIGVVWLFMFERAQTEHVVSLEEGNGRSTVSDPGGSLATSPQASIDTSKLKPAYTFTRFGLWATPNTGATPSNQQGSQDSSAYTPIPLPASTTPVPQPGFDQRAAAETESFRIDERANGDSPRITGRREGHRRKSRPKGQYGRVRASQRSFAPRTSKTAYVRFGTRWWNEAKKPGSSNDTSSQPRRSFEASAISSFTQAYRRRDGPTAKNAGMMRPAGFFVYLLLFSICGHAQPVLRWAADPNSNAPYTFYAPGKALTGFEYEIINRVARRLGRRAEFVQNDWNGLIPGLHRALYDCVICGIEITPDKAQEVSFSIPYYFTFEQFVGRRGTPPLASLEELRGREVGTLDQTAALRMLENTPGVIAKTYDQELNAYQDVVNGRLFGVLLDYPIAKYYAAPNPELQLNGPPFGQIAYGIAVDKSNPALQAEIDVALRELIASGELRSILSRWGLWTDTVAQAFGAPADPSAPDTEYQEFVSGQISQASLWSRLQNYLAAGPLLRRAALLTLAVSLASMAVAVAVGFLLAVCRVFGPLPVRWLATAYIEVMRGTPLLIQLLFIFYGLPNIGLRLSPFAASVLGLGLNYAASEAEVYRAGLLSVPAGQWHAAYALGLTRVNALRLIIVPQAIRLILPPFTNDFIALLKDSSLVSALTMVELTGAYNRLATETFDYFGTGLLVAFLYLLLGLPFARLARSMEERLAKGRFNPMVIRSDFRRRGS